jgi:TorA maturation chaperone TorD
MYVSNTNAFLTEHLLSWVPRFPEGPFRCDEADFYKGIAKITNCFVMADLMFLGSSPSRVGKSWCS